MVLVRPVDELALFRASFVFGGFDFKKLELSPLVVQPSTTNMVLMEEATRHPGTLSLKFFFGDSTNFLFFVFILRETTE